MKKLYAEFLKLINESNKILIIQPDNPDGDSLGSALALEEILTIQNKQTYLYCGVNIPEYLKYMTGWSRVKNTLPTTFDLAIIVDNSAISLLEKLSKLDRIVLANHQVVILDHHAVENTISFAKLIINEPLSSTGELIYNLIREFNFSLNKEAANYLTVSILSDTLGLTTEQTTSKTIRTVADLVDEGVSLAKLDSLRRESNQKSLQLTKYKGELLQRIETYLDNQLALSVIPQNEINQYSPEFNPSILILEDMRLIKNVKIAIVLKTYQDGKITAKIRSNYGFPIANKVAEAFGGGGHSYASGFKTIKYDSVNSLMPELLNKVNQLLSDENI